jgi:diguanylate cyclase (GGDEF)-like protein
MAPPGPSRSQRLALALLIVFAAAGGAAVHAFLIPERRAPFPGWTMTWWMLAAGFFLAESLVLHLPRREQTHTISLTEIPLVLGLAFAGPGALIIGRLLGGMAGLLVVRGQRSPVKLAFNASVFHLEAATACAVYGTVLGSSTPARPIGWLAAIIALAAGQLIGASMVTAAIATRESRVDLAQVTSDLIFGSTFSLTSGLWGVVAVTSLWYDATTAVPILALGTLIYGALRLFGRLRRRHDELQSVYAFTQAVDGSSSVDELMPVVLGHLRDRFRTRFAAIAVPDPEAGEAVCVLLDGGELIMHRSPLVGSGGVADAAVLRPGSVEPIGGETAAMVRELCGRPLTGGLCAAVGGTGSVIVVAERLGHEDFDAHEYPLLGALARHTDAVLERGSLIDRLRGEIALRRHEALHDQLTELPNRTAFVEAADRAMAARGADRVAVLLMDLDRFKDVNDTLGHHEGDRLLVDVAVRIRDVIRPGDTLARIGGDEFAVLLTVGSVADAIGIVRRIETALGLPFDRAGISIDVSASIGIALSGNATSSTDLLQHADIAMYAAKAVGSGYEIYEPSLDHYSPARLALAGELRPAIGAGEIMVHYQPKIRISDGGVVGAEALARWVHPTRGPISPGDFIPIAERTGLIKHLTRYVLATALHDAAGWRTEAAPGVSVAVNVSPTALIDKSFVSTVEGLLEDSGLPPAALIVEITEEALLGSATAAGAALEYLDHMGVEVSIDDFGTGHSSLTRLRSLPISEVKIDRSFVSAMLTDAGSEVIVGSTIDLAQRLGLRVVAEGVETAEELALLELMSCTEVQGFLYSPALPADRFLEWVRRHRDGVEAGPRELSA